MEREPELGQIAVWRQLGGRLMSAQQETPIKTVLLQLQILGMDVEIFERREQM